MKIYTKTLQQLLLLVALGLAAADIDSVIKIDPLTDTGFHYEYQTNLGFVVNTWSFILNIEYTILRDRLVELKNVSNTLMVSLDRGGVLANCSWNDGGGYKRELDYVITRKLQNLFETHDSIEYLLIHKRLPDHKRKKRGLFGGAFNFMGRFYKYTMGVMDDEDAALLYDLANHENTTEYRIKMLTNETLQIGKYLQSIRHDLENTLNCHYLERQLVYLKDNLEEIETTYNKIVTGIQMAMYSTRLSSLIMDPKTLLAELDEVDNKRWDSESVWAVQPQIENMHSVMQVITCFVFINPRGQLMFVIQVPRIDKTRYDLYKPVAIPECVDPPVCKFLAPQSAYIGFESRGEQKHFVRIDDTTTCTHIENLTLCYGSVTSQKIEYSSDCDVRLFKGLSWEKCPVHATKFHTEIFYSLNNVNRWLFMVGEKGVRAEFNCGTGKYDKHIILRGMGILTMLKYCKLRTARSTLTSKHVTSDYEIDQFKVVNFNFSGFVLPRDTKDLGKRVIKDLNYDTLNDVTSHLNRLVTQEEADTAISAHTPDDNTNANWYSNLFGNWWWELKFIAYVIVIIIIAWIVFSLKRCMCSNSTLIPILQPKY
uniref:Budded virus envelope fusion protein EFP n=1 Tax=Phthorimaea operculella granulovirus TaxID=192584 RepID=A0A481SCU6_9BBAC|nr:budded virus envelope fusion protein EFP [Phthorimaea operculella granulovirus]QBH66252.1 budded virus envelope fusion protein EFP [Phthorimaea operculella granulovirus]QBH66382.1 budded virus envelope fusion protein EFP [Phthorimaea operculella granulovirus]